MFCSINKNDGFCLIIIKFCTVLDNALNNNNWLCR